MTCKKGNEKLRGEKIYNVPISEIGQIKINLTGKSDREL
jgi:hypothetical protein